MSGEHYWRGGDGPRRDWRPGGPARLQPPKQLLKQQRASCLTRLVRLRARANWLPVFTAECPGLRRIVRTVSGAELGKR